jgi:DNA sulfur modification protein DndD
MILAEYLRFMQSLNGTTVPADVCKIANLVLQNLTELIPLSTAQGHRVKKVVELAQANWRTISADIQPIPEQTPEQTLPITQLKSLSVGPFRGFAKQEVFDLASSLVLIYGPNGTGKSSFCEALEYGMLGNVVDAESKRFSNQQDYMVNAFTNTFESPEIIGHDDQGHDVSVRANEANYRFCFIEKNRINSFSRIAALTPAKQTELISTLFGLEFFNEFVHNFTSEIDERYIDLVGIKATDLSQKRQTLMGSQEQIKLRIEDLKKLDKVEYSLSQQYKEGSTFAQMVAELNGDEDNPGKIQKFQTELQKPISTKSNVTIADLKTLRQSINTNLNDLSTIQKELSTASQQVSFKQLYEAVTEVQVSSPEHCPACKTPLTKAVVNPYTHAGVELKKLQHLARLQQSLQQLNQSLTHSLTEISQILNTCCIRSTPNPLDTYHNASNMLANTEWWNTLLQQPQDGLSPWQQIEFQVEQLEDIDKEIDQVEKERTTKQEELNQYREHAKEIVKLQTLRESTEEQIIIAQQTITNFDDENSMLIADVESENEVVSRNQAIAIGYDNFVNRINSYKNALPARLVADLGDTVAELYNAFNRNDATNDKLADVRLPLEQNQRLEISFQDDPSTFFDALHVLSEGHIRCLGLAILLAKNLKENCPILIFDDPVNAIDDDHREAIRRTLFEDSFFTDKQIIISCHGEEFFKDIQNLLSAEQVSNSKAFTFLPSLGEKHIMVDFNCASRNYIISAQIHVDKGEIRDALVKSRQALESITKGRLWPYVDKYGDGYLSIKLRSTTASMELRNLTEQLKSKIAKTDFTDPNKSNISSPLEFLLGINGDSREWRYLNKGTHDETDRAEFDRSTVQNIVTYLEQLDTALG